MLTDLFFLVGTEFDLSRIEEAKVFHVAVLGCQEGCSTGCIFGDPDRSSIYQSCGLIA
jgi:hypothetical protein